MNRSRYLSSADRRKSTERDMRTLLASYVKYAALVQFQEEALEEEDLDRYDDLAEAREALQEELGDEPPPFPDPDRLDAENREYFERVYESFRDALERDTQLQTRLKRLKKEASTDLEGMKGRDEQLKGYLKGDEATTGHRKGRLNVRM